MEKQTTKCAICGYPCFEGDYILENSEGRNITVCNDCYNQNGVVAVDGKIVTAKRARESMELYRDIFSKSYTDSVEIIELFDGVKYPKPYACTAKLIEADGDKITQREVFYNPRVTHTETCNCGKHNHDKYIIKYDGSKTINSLFIDGCFYAPECIDKIVKVKDFMTGEYITSATVFEGHILRPETLRRFENYNWKTVHCYHDIPTFIPKTRARCAKNFKGLGFELETVYEFLEEDYYDLHNDYDDDDDYDDDYGTSEQMCYELATTFDKLFYCNTDGSLSHDGERDGAEIISRACDWKFWQDFDFRKFDKILYNHNRVSGEMEGARVCGMHIHASANYFGKRYDDRVRNIAKVLLFFKRNEDKISKFAGRNYNDYAERLDDDCDTFTGAKDYANRDHYSRYEAINLCNGITGDLGHIEFRIFDGTTSGTKIKTNLEFVHLLCSNAPRYRKESDFLDPKKLFDGCSKELHERLVKCGLLDGGEGVCA